MDTATQLGASSASASFAGTDSTLAVAATVHDLLMMIPDPIDTATKHVASSASATSARADGTSAATATEHGASSASATSARADGTSAVTATQQDHNSMVEDLYYGLLIFLRDALADVCSACSPSASVRMECAWVVYALFDAWCHRAGQRYYALFSEPALLKHKEIFDILRYDKKGNPKENCFLKWCRQVHALREAHGTTTKHASPSDDQETRCYKILAERMLRDDLLPHQRKKRVSNSLRQQRKCEPEWKTAQLDFAYAAEKSWP